MKGRQGDDAKDEDIMAEFDALHEIVNTSPTTVEQVHLIHLGILDNRRTQKHCDPLSR